MLYKIQIVDPSKIWALGVGHHNVMLCNKPTHAQTYLCCSVCTESKDSNITYFNLSLSVCVSWNQIYIAVCVCLFKVLVCNGVTVGQSVCIQEIYSYWFLDQLQSFSCSRCVNNLNLDSVCASLATKIIMFVLKFSQTTVQWYLKWIWS